ncbi:MAG: hypothetical protein B6A08_08535 [Sorangiineae bacterium NIC37A_2]|nr:MAG: hypothetical protein B6A08_08535 [Sorangiineae bacterium NIC37A_2]
MTDYLLIGMLDSPFVRRVAIALELYGKSYDNLALRTVGDAERFAEYSPLRRAPTLRLPSGELLMDSHVILAYLDEQEPKQRVLLPESPEDRLKARQIIGVAAGLADKAVHGVYELNFHAPEARSRPWLERIRTQLQDSARWLDQRAPESGFLSERISHADIIVGTALRFATDAHPDFRLFDLAPRLEAFCARLEALPEFRKTYLPLEPPKLN